MISNDSIGGYMSFINLINEDGLVKQNLEEESKVNEPFKSIIKRSHIHTVGNVLELQQETLSEKKSTIRLHKKEGEIVQIEFVCQCGEIVTLDVGYENIEVTEHA